MKKVFCIFLVLILLTGSANIQINASNGESVDCLSMITAENTTDRVIGKYIDRITGQEIYRSVKASDIYDIKIDNTIFNKRITFKCNLEGTYTYGRLNSAVDMEFVQPDFIRKAYSAESKTRSLSWGSERIGADSIIKHIDKSGKSVLVAVIDSGVDMGHEFLKNRITNGYDFVDDDNDPYDGNGHGTHVAGIIADSTSENVKIMPIRVLDDMGYGYDYEIAQGILLCSKK